MSDSQQADPVIANGDASRQGRRSMVVVSASSNGENLLIFCKMPSGAVAFSCWRQFVPPAGLAAHHFSSSALNPTTHICLYMYGISSRICIFNMNLILIRIFPGGFLCQISGPLLTRCLAPELSEILFFPFLFAAGTI